MAEPVQIDGDDLVWGSRRAGVSEVRGLLERFGNWTGRATLLVRGPGWRIPIEAGYADSRRTLRAAFPRSWFTADWRDGRFPAFPMGLPQNAVAAVAVVAAMLASVAAGVTVGPGAALVVGLAAAWPVGRLRDHVAVRRHGIRVGPAWGALVPWHRVDSVVVRVGRRRSVVWTRGPGGGGRATVPTVLLPALRARLWRLGGLRLGQAEGGAIDDRYERWRGPAAGIPWGVLLGTLAVAPLTETPWTALTAGVLTTGALAMLGAAVEARATGWGSGAVFWGTGVYAVVLVAITLGAGTYLGGS